MSTKTQEQDYLIGYIKSVRSKLLSKGYLANAPEKVIREDYKKLFEAEDKLSGTLKVPTQVTSIKDVWASLKTKPKQAMSNSVKKKFTDIEEKLEKVEAKRGIEYDHANKTVSVFINPNDYLGEDDKETMYKELVKKGIITDKYVLLVF